MRLFAYSLDLALCNAWLLYKRDCKALRKMNHLPLKEFRIEVFKGTRNLQNPAIHRATRSVATSPGSSSNSSPISLSSISSGGIGTDSSCTFERPNTARGQRSQAPENAVRFNKTLNHVPLYQSRQTCKQCSRQGHIIRSNFVCKVCKVHLCLNADRNCFLEYHEAVA